MRHPDISSFASFSRPSAAGANYSFGRREMLKRGFQFVVFKQGLRGWNVAKYRLAFCTVTQDGDTEGAFILDRLPSRPEAEIIRAVLRIPKRRHLSEAQREIATERLARARLNAQKPASPVPAVNWYRPGNSRPS